MKGVPKLETAVKLKLNKRGTCVFTCVFWAKPLLSSLLPPIGLLGFYCRSKVYVHFLIDQEFA